MYTVWPCFSLEASTIRSHRGRRSRSAKYVTGLRERFEMVSTAIRLAVVSFVQPAKEIVTGCLRGTSRSKNIKPRPARITRKTSRVQSRIRRSILQGTFIGLARLRTSGPVDFAIVKRQLFGLILGRVLLQRIAA